VDRVNNSDTLEIMVEMSAARFSDSLAKIAEMEKELVGALKAMLGIMAKVKLVAPKTIARSEGKAVRIIDNRKI
jgi:phenylacetate-CoA ligase